MADIQKPIVPAETSATTAEPTVAPTAAVTADKPAEVVEPKVEEPAKTEGETVPTATEEKKEEKKEVKEEKPEEPITSGALGYKAPGLKNVFRFSKKYFWFGEEPVPASSLSAYLRGEKPEVAHPVAAWSSQTGKGLLYFVKHADQKESPAGVLDLANASDLTKDGTVAFHFKLHGQKHAFEAQTSRERNGWFVAVEKAIEEAKASKEGIVSSEGYKEQLEKLGKPATLAATAAKEGSTPKKSTDATPKLAETEGAATEEAAAPARTGSSSSSSSDEDKKKSKKTKSKSRSVSRGKRASIFGGFLGKKDKAEEKVEEKKEEKKEDKEAKEAKKEETPAPATAEPSTAIAPLPVTEEAPKPVEEAKTEETPAVVAEDKKPEEKKVEEEKPKPTKRGSIFGNFVEKLKSPTTEKKESEVAPAPVAPVKETEPVAAEPPKIEETPAAPAPGIDATPAEAPKTEETKPAASGTTPAKEKHGFSFGKFLGGGKEKVKSPTTEKTPDVPPKIEEPAKTEETPALAPVAAEPVAEAPKEETKEEKKEEETPATSTTPTTQKKRGSIFGNLKKEGESLTGLFRNASKAGKSKKEKETTTTPAKVEETAEPKEEKTEAAPAVEPKKEEAAAPAAPTEQQSIGDVVPDAVTVGQAPKSTPPVATTA